MRRLFCKRYSEMGVDVMIAGHTHQLSVRQGNEGGLYINPGSVSENCEMSFARRKNLLLLIHVESSLYPNVV